VSAWWAHRPLRRRKRVRGVGIGSGLAAGAAGTTALNVVTYLDMTLRGRPSSTMPAEAAEQLTGKVHVPLGEGDQRDARKEGLGALLGYATGLAVGAAYGLLRSRVRVPWPVAALGLSALAMAGSDAPLTALGLTDPRDWPASSWVSDVVPHLAYGTVAAVTYELTSRP
jgi:xanthosine utilization system XapX-like protein